MARAGSGGLLSRQGQCQCPLVPPPAHGLQLLVVLVALTSVPLLEGHWGALWNLWLLWELWCQSTAPWLSVARACRVEAVTPLGSCEGLGDWAETPQVPRVPLDQVVLRQDLLPGQSRWNGSVF